MQDDQAVNSYAGDAVAVRETPAASDLADYVLFGNPQGIGLIEARRVGTILERQTEL